MRPVVVILALLSIPFAQVRAESWRFAIAGDSYGTAFTYDEDCVNTVILGELVEELLSHNVECLLFTGDLVMGDGCACDMETQLNTWRATLQPLYDAGVNVYPVRGNHDDDAGLVPWNSVFSGEYALPANGPPGEENLTFSALHRNALFIGLDLYANLHRVNQDWLDAQLAGNAAPHLFVFAHEPAFSVAHDDCMGYFPRERDAFWQSIADAGGRAYFCAHDHFYNHARIDDGDGNPDNDVHQFVAGTAGSIQWYFWDSAYNGDNGDVNPALVEHIHPGYGYILGKIDDFSVTLTFMLRNTDDLTLPGRYAQADTWSYTFEPTIVVLYPNGGERLVAGRDAMIQWRQNTVGAVSNTRLQYHDGSTWHDINAAPLAADAGSYPWNTAGIAESNAYLIRISDWDNAAVNDASDAPFTVFNCRTPLPADLNGDCYVDMQDLALLAADWLRCGNPFDPACQSE